MLTITTLVIISNCRPAGGNNSHNLITLLLTVNSLQREKAFVDVKFVCDLVSMLKPMDAIFKSTLEA
jgi:hypothetical protein